MKKKQSRRMRFTGIFVLMIVVLFLRLNSSDCSWSFTQSQTLMQESCDDWCGVVGCEQVVLWGCWCNDAGKSWNCTCYWFDACNDGWASGQLSRTDVSWGCAWAN